jgi:hypothetical protein
MKKRTELQSTKKVSRRQALAARRPDQKMGVRHDQLLSDNGELLALHGRPRKELKRRTWRKNRHRTRRELRLFGS